MDDTKLCPFCAEEIKEAAVKCKHCGSMLENEISQKTKASKPVRERIEHILLNIKNRLKKPPTEVKNDVGDMEGKLDKLRSLFEIAWADKELTNDEEKLLMAKVTEWNIPIEKVKEINDEIYYKRINGDYGSVNGEKWKERKRILDGAIDFEKCKESVICIIDTGGIVGAGFIIDESGIAVTNAHVVKNNIFINIQFKDRSSGGGEVIFKDEKMDIAFIRLNRRDIKALNFCEDYKSGDTVYAIGHPYQFGFSLTKGIISNVLKPENGPERIQTDVPLNPGNSGGPLLNEKGKVIGLTSCIHAFGTGLGFALSVKNFKAELEQVKRHPRLQVLESLDPTPSSYDQNVSLPDQSEEEIYKFIKRAGCVGCLFIFLLMGTCSACMEYL